MIGWIRLSIAHVVLWLDLFEFQYIDASVYKIPRQKVDAVPWLEPFLSECNCCWDSAPGG